MLLPIYPRANLTLTQFRETMRIFQGEEIRRAHTWEAKYISENWSYSKRFLLLHNDGGEARGKTEKRRMVVTFHLHTRMQKGLIFLL